MPEGGFLQRDAPPFDFAFWLRMAREWDVAFVDEVLCQYRIHGQSFTSGLSDVTGTGYLQAEKTLREVHAVKRRYGALRGPRPRRALADRALRQDIISRVRERTLPDRPFVATFRGLGDAAAARARHPARAARLGAARRQRRRASRWSGG